MDVEEGVSESSSLSTGVEETSEAVNATEKQVEPEPEKNPHLDTQETEKKAVKAVKVEVRLQAVGDAPIMKQKNYKVDGEKQISWILSFIRKFLKLKTTDALFLYVNQAFAPSPDQTVANLSQCFGQDNKLVLYYSRSQAYG